MLMPKSAMSNMMMSNSMMFISMFIIQYVFMSYIMTNSVANMTNSIGKVYMSTMMGLFMVVVGILMGHHLKIKELIFFGSLLVLCIYLYKIQFGIASKDYLREMIEHHSMALLTSDRILKKNPPTEVAQLAQRILSTQEKEIKEMQNILEKSI